jgi:DNA repair exonuclease SbcCD ATPase subunit
MTTELKVEINSQIKEKEESFVKKTVVCLKCQKECKSTQGLAIHSKTCGQEKNVACIACHVIFPTKYKLTNHLKKCNILKQQENKSFFEKQQEEINKDYQDQIEDFKSEIQQIKKDSINAFKVKDEEWTRRLESELKLKDLHYNNLQKDYDKLQEERKDLIRQRERLETQLAEAIREIALDKHRITDLASKFLEKMIKTT